MSDSATNSLIPPEDLAPFTDRMRRLTGFVTVLPGPADQRPLVFARYYHVRRVVWLAKQLANRSTSSLDLDRIEWLAWAHDLNRWPFAHNSEKGLFQHENDVHRYFSLHVPSAPVLDLNELRDIICKKHALLSQEGRVVLFADILAGFLEDPLWAIVALDLRPEFVPSPVFDFLGIDVRDTKTLSALMGMSMLFAETRAPEPFATEFDGLFTMAALRTIQLHDFGRRIPLGEDDFEEQRQLIKEGFMRGKLFRYNNVLISKGPLLKNEIVVPLLQKLGDQATSALTEMDDAQALDFSLGPYRGNEARQRFLPDLDYVTRNEPEMSFRRLIGSVFEK